LYVTIVREGSEVVWRNWRWRLLPELPGEFRFDAAEYDAEVARAEADHGWEWPARTVARLVNDRLRADPTVLGRWGCEYGHCRNSVRHHDFASLSFFHPAGADSQATSRIGIDVSDRDPDVVADEVIAMLCAADPRETAEKSPGSW
ncbi:MAG TPA: hypothetical protein VF821_25935, partial [Lentzea sp.]